MYSILIADDNPENLKVLSALLKDEGYEIRIAINGDQAWQSIQSEPPDLIMLDIQMPKIDGYEVCRLVRAESELKTIPIIFISAMMEPFNKVMAFKAGGDDYMTKPLQAEEVVARVKTHLKIHDYQKQLEEKNIDLLQQFQSTFEQAAVGIAHIESDTLKLIRVNSRFTTILGYEKELLLSKTLMDIFSSQPLGEDADSITQLITGKKYSISNIRQFVKNDGQEIWCKVTISLVEPIKGHISNYFVAILEDVSEQKQMEKRELEYERRIQQAQKIEAIGTLAGGIAHDFNNILTPVIGYTEILKEEIDKESNLQEMISQVLSAGYRARELVRQILTFSRENTQEAMPLKLQPVIQEAIRLLRSSLPTTIEINPKIDPSCEAVNGDATQIHQVVMNLGTNAYHAMEKDGGELQISLSKVQLEGVDSNILGLPSGDYACLQVADTGLGIKGDEVKKIFDPYFTTKEKTKGTGLGLSVVLGIVKKHGGSIDVKSLEGQGTTMSVYFPIIKRIEPQSEIIFDESIARGTEKLLLVDDEEIIVNLMTDLLSRLGYSVVSCSGAEEAYEVFQNNPNRFDLLITDYTMPQMRGTKLVEMIKKIRPELPCVLCTGFTDQVDIDEVKELQIGAIVSKPFSVQDISSAIRRCFNQTASSELSSNGG